MSGHPYSRSARYYDLLYEGRDEARECDLLEELIHTHARLPCRRVLDLGSGTGAHALELAARGYQVQGIDRSEEFVKLARDKAASLDNPPTFQVGDMRDLRVSGEFDAVISMFGALGYVPRDSLPKTLGTVLARLQKGGLLMFEFWNLKGVEDGHMSWEIKEREDLRLLRLGKSELDAKARRLNLYMSHFVLQGKRLTEDFQELHSLSLYDQEEMEAILLKAGLRPLAMLDWDRKNLDPARPNDFRIFAVARREVS